MNIHSQQLEKPSGKHSKNYGKSQFLMGKSTISMAMFNSFLYVYQLGKYQRFFGLHGVGTRVLI